MDMNPVSFSLHRLRRWLPGRAAGPRIAAALAAVTGCCGSAQAQPVSPEPTLAALMGHIAPAGFRSGGPELEVLAAPASTLGERVVSRGAYATDHYGRPLLEVGGAALRWWVMRGGSQFGMGVGAMGYAVPSLDAKAGGALTPAYASSVLTLGWRYQLNDRSMLFADASGERRFSAEGVDRYSTKVGVHWKSKSSRFGLEKGSRSLGLQLDSNYRMALKLRRNGAILSVRGQF